MPTIQYSPSDPPALDRSASTPYLSKPLIEKQNKLQPCYSLHVISAVQNDSRDINQMKRCLTCDSDFVPEILICSVDPPSGLEFLGRPELIQVRGIKLKKNSHHGSIQTKLEKEAFQISEKVFFLESGLYSQLITKLKLMGKNSVFSLRSKITIANNFITCIVTGTALSLAALPIPKPPLFTSQKPTQSNFRSYQLSPNDQKR